MKNLFTALKQLLGNTSDEYRLIRGRFFRILGLIFAASLLGVALNFLGLKTANAIIGCILPFIALYMFTAPEIIGSIVLAGLVTSLKHPVTGIKRVAELVGQALAWIVLVTSLFFLVVGTLPLGRNFSAIWVIYLSFGILLLMDVRNIKRTRFAMGLLYAYAVIALVLSLGSMIPGPVHIKVYGHDLFAWSRISVAEKAVYEAGQVASDSQAAKDAEKLKETITFLNSGYTIADLSYENQKFFYAQRAAATKGSLPNRAIALVTGAGIEETADYRIEKKSGGIWVVTFKTTNPVVLPIGLEAHFLISTSEAINLQWPVMGRPSEWCSVPLNTIITNKVFANLVLKGEAGKTITIKLL